MSPNPKRFFADSGEGQRREKASGADNDDRGTAAATSDDSRQAAAAAFAGGIGDQQAVDVAGLRQRGGGLFRPLAQGGKNRDAQEKIASGGHSGGATFT